MELKPEIIKVSTKSRTASVAGAIAGIIRDKGHAEVQAIGAGAVNQALKAIAIARNYLMEEGHDIVCVPSFVDVMIEDAERTALRLVVFPRNQEQMSGQWGITIGHDALASLSS